MLPSTAQYAAMGLRPLHHMLEARKKRSLLRRMVIVHGVLLFFALLVVARLLELQVVNQSDYTALAQSQHLEGVTIPARRGEILALNSKTGETVMLATNTTLDLVYVDPLVTDDPLLVAETLADVLLTEEYHAACTAGRPECPRELVPLYAPAFDPLLLARKVQTETLFEEVPDTLARPAALAEDLPDFTEARRQFARAIEERISDERVRFVPLKYGATKMEMDNVLQLGLTGVSVNEDANLIYADPESIPDADRKRIATQLADALQLEPTSVTNSIRSRPLRYVPVMRKVSTDLSLALKERKLESLRATNQRRSEAATREDAQAMTDPLRSIAIIAEHWRFYPDDTIASQVVGFLNASQEAQYGVERTFDSVLRGQEGLISTVSDIHRGQILTSDQQIVDPEDGSTVVLTIDPFIQKEVERLMEEAVENFEAESGQAIVMDPRTGAVLAMVSAPVYERNNFSSVYTKEPITLPPEKEKEIVVEIYHPETNARLVKAYYDDIFTDAGRELLAEQTKVVLDEMEQLYDLDKLARYYLYVGEHYRKEIFPTDVPRVWLQFSNQIGVGAYLNPNVQQIYEPGSVMKSITMAIAIDQGEIVPSDRYLDEGPVEVDEFTINNAFFDHYGNVTMTNCLEFSINTCMTDVSGKLGRKLFHHMLERFGFGHITGIELEDELPGELPSWRRWSNSLLATASFGQGISVTPLQMIAAYTPLANGGKLMKPYIVDRIEHSNGTVDYTEPRVLDQVLTPEASETVTAMMVSSAELGFAKTGRVDGYKVAGKTGTSQIAGPGGRYESGTGSTIATYAGYAPPEDPQFLILVKFNRTIRDPYGSSTAGPTFSKIAKFLFQYYGIPPQV